MTMDMNENWKLIKNIVVTHYNDPNPRPLLLAALGDQLKQRDLRLDGARSLHQFIKDMCDPDIEIVRDEISPAYIAVCTAKTRSNVENYIKTRHEQNQSRSHALSSLSDACDNQTNVKQLRNALQRLIAAQPVGVANRMLIPADIALILIESK